MTISRDVVVTNESDWPLVGVVVEAYDPDDRTRPIAFATTDFGGKASFPELPDTGRFIFKPRITRSSAAFGGDTQNGVVNVQVVVPFGEGEGDDEDCDEQHWATVSTLFTNGSANTHERGILVVAGREPVPPSIASVTGANLSVLATDVGDWTIISGNLRAQHITVYLVTPTGENSPSINVNPGTNGVSTLRVFRACLPFADDESIAVEANIDMESAFREDESPHPDEVVNLGAVTTGVAAADNTEAILVRTYESSTLNQVSSTSLFNGEAANGATNTAIGPATGVNSFQKAHTFSHNPFVELDGQWGIAIVGAKLTIVGA